jgi:hypothetical protein
MFAGLSLKLCFTGIAWKFREAPIPAQGSRGADTEGEGEDVSDRLLLSLWRAAMTANIQNEKADRPGTGTTGPDKQRTGQGLGRGGGKGRRDGTGGGKGRGGGGHGGGGGGRGRCNR